MLIALLGPDAEASFAMFSAVHQTAQNSALKAAAQKVLPPEEKDVFDALLSFIRAVDKHRNRLAHGIWITCVEVPDGFIVGGTDEHFRFMVENAKELSRIYPA